MNAMQHTAHVAFPLVSICFHGCHGASFSQSENAVYTTRLLWAVEPLQVPTIIFSTPYMWETKGAKKRGKYGLLLFFFFFLLFFFFFFFFFFFGGGEVVKKKKQYCFLGEVFFSSSVSMKIILGPPKHVLHLVWSAFVRGWFNNPRHGNFPL